MHDEAALGIELADRMQAADEDAVLGDARQRRGAHARHELHVGDDVGAVGDLDAATRRAANRSGPCNTGSRTSCARACSRRTAHPSSRALRPAPSSGCSGRRPPSRSVQTKVRCSTRATSRRMRAMQVAAGKGFGIQRMQLAGREHAVAQFLEFGLGAVAPVHAFRARVLGHLFHPAAERFGSDRGDFQPVGCGRHDNLEGTRQGL